VFENGLSRSFTDTGARQVIRRSDQRTVQFLVERPCFEANYGLKAAANGVFPIAIWVFWPPEENVNFGCSARQIWRHDPRTDALGAEQPGQCVCEHMGHLIE
jgi:hypothetical protein